MEHKGFTPGPWKVSRYSNYEGFSIFAGEDAAVRGCIAERWFAYALNEAQNEECVANAQLIADAPNLVDERDRFREALRKAKGANVILAFDSSRDSNLRGEYMAIVEAIDAALSGFPLPSKAEHNEHNKHWRNPETGEAECECCCKWALDYERLRDVNQKLLEALELARPVVDKELQSLCASFCPPCEVGETFDYSELKDPEKSWITDTEAVLDAVEAALAAAKEQP